MQHADVMFDPDLAKLSKSEWLSEIEAVTKKQGFFESLGNRHYAGFVSCGDTLLVTFESIQGIRTLCESEQPFGFEMVRSQEWSHLCMISDGDTWFRDPQIFNFFDRLIDDGFFEEFDNVVFYGAGPCGYAASTFSVAAPGSTVVVVQPQATLDPRMTEWDDRFKHMRNTSFTNRFGYAPDMLDACAQAYVLYDPAETMDAMHAVLFERSNVTRFPMRFIGDAIQSDLLAMGILVPMLTQAKNGRLNKTSFAALYRTRRTHSPYLWRLMAALDKQGREKLARIVAQNVTSRMKAPRFRRRLDEIQTKTRSSIEG